MSVRKHAEAIKDDGTRRVPTTSSTAEVVLYPGGLVDTVRYEGARCTARSDEVVEAGIETLGVRRESSKTLASYRASNASRGQARIRWEKTLGSPPRAIKPM